MHDPEPEIVRVSGVADVQRIRQQDSAVIMRAQLRANSLETVCAERAPIDALIPFNQRPVDRRDLVALHCRIFSILAAVTRTLQGQAGGARVTIHGYVHPFSKVRGLYEFVERPRHAEESPPFSACRPTTDNFRLVPRGTICQDIKNANFARTTW